MMGVGSGRMGREGEGKEKDGGGGELKERKSFVKYSSNVKRMLREQI